MNQESGVRNQESGNPPAAHTPLSKGVGGGFTADNADTCARWLKVNGFEVLCVQSGRRNPRITIKTSPLCEQLEGAVRMYSRGIEGERRYYVAIRFGCEVRWPEIPPHPPLTKGGSVAGGFGEGRQS